MIQINVKFFKRCMLQKALSIGALSLFFSLTRANFENSVTERLVFIDSNWVLYATSSQETLKQITVDGTPITVDSIAFIPDKSGLTLAHLRQPVTSLFLVPRISVSAPSGNTIAFGAGQFISLDLSNPLAAPLKSLTGVYNETRSSIELNQGRQNWISNTLIQSALDEVLLPPRRSSAAIQESHANFHSLRPVVTAKSLASAVVRITRQPEVVPPMPLRNNAGLGGASPTATLIAPDCVLTAYYNDKLDFNKVIAKNADHYVVNSADISSVKLRLAFLDKPITSVQCIPLGSFAGSSPAEALSVALYGEGNVRPGLGWRHVRPAQENGLDIFAEVSDGSSQSLKAKFHPSFILQDNQYTDGAGLYAFSAEPWSSQSQLYAAKLLRTIGMKVPRGSQNSQQISFSGSTKNSITNIMIEYALNFPNRDNRTALIQDAVIKPLAPQSYTPVFGDGIGSTVVAPSQEMPSTHPSYKPKPLRRDSGSGTSAHTPRQPRITQGGSSGIPSPSSNDARLADQKDRVLGSILGGIVGECLGVQFEDLSKLADYRTTQNRYKSEFTFTGIGSGPKKGSELQIVAAKGYDAGELGPNSQRVLQLVDSILEQKAFNPSDFKFKLAQWQNSPNCKACEGSDAVTKAELSRYWNAVQSGTSLSEYANADPVQEESGPLFAAVPLAILSLSKKDAPQGRLEAMENAFNQAKITHHNNTVMHGTGLIALMVRAALLPQSSNKLNEKKRMIEARQDIITALQSKGSSLSGKINAHVEADTSQHDWAKIAKWVAMPYNKQDAQHTILVALWSVYNSEFFEEAVAKAVHFHGDSMGAGAVAGALAGSIYGLKSIPAKWLDKVKNKDAIIAKVEKLYELSK